MKEIRYPKKSQALMGNTRRLGKKQSIEARLKISLANKGKKHPNKGGTISEKHKQKSSQKKKDLVRQQNIINTIHPRKFWRYDFMNKKFQNVIG